MEAKYRLAECAGWKAQREVSSHLLQNCQNINPLL